MFKYLWNLNITMQVMMVNQDKKSQKKSKVPDGVHVLRQRLRDSGRIRWQEACNTRWETPQKQHQLLRMADKVDEIACHLSDKSGGIRKSAATALGDIVVEGEYHSIDTRIHALGSLLRHQEIWEVHNVLSGMEIDCTTRKKIVEEQETAEKLSKRSENKYLLSIMMAIGTFITATSSAGLAIGLALASIYSLCIAILQSNQVKSPDQILKEFIE